MIVRHRGTRLFAAIILGAGFFGWTEFAVPFSSLPKLDRRTELSAALARRWFA
jgi:hypothetical protein